MRALLGEGGIDLVTTSLALPDGDGIAVAEAVRESAGQAYVPVIVVSGEAQARLEARTLGEEVTDAFTEQPSLHSGGRGIGVETHGLHLHGEHAVVGPAFELGGVVVVEGVAAHDVADVRGETAFLRDLVRGQQKFEAGDGREGFLSETNFILITQNQIIPKS